MTEPCLDHDCPCELHVKLRDASKSNDSGPKAMTPGPWCVGPSREHDFNGVKMWTVSVNVGEVGNHGNQIASVQLGGPGAVHSDRESVFANARAIAALPFLVEALEEISAGPLMVRDCQFFARQALAKLRGEQ